jgi:hypothetical protein
MTRNSVRRQTGGSLTAGTGAGQGAHDGAPLCGGAGPPQRGAGVCVCVCVCVCMRVGSTLRRSGATSTWCRCALGPARDVCACDTHGMGVAGWGGGGGGGMIDTDYPERGMWGLW